MKEIHLVIVSPETMIFDGQVDSVTLPGESGKFQVLAHHAPLISSLTGGEICYEAGQESRSLHIQEGFVEVKDNQISVCVEL